MQIANAFRLLARRPGNQKRFWRDPVKRAGRLEATPWFNRQGQAHIMSIATASPDPRCAPGAGVRLRTWFSFDPQPASINPTINISIVFICAFLVDCGRIIRHLGSGIVSER
jgi:hypothetical protein